MRRTIVAGTAIPILLVLSLTVWFFAPHRSDEISAAENSNVRLQELYAARITLLEKMLQDVKTAHTNSTATLEQVHQSQAALFKAQLDQAGSKADRITILQKMLDQDKQREQALIGLREKGAVPEGQFLQTQVDRLNSEITLESAMAEK